MKQYQNKELLRALCFLPKSFYFFFNCIAHYAQSKESRNLSSNVAIKRVKSNALALALSSDSNIDEVNNVKLRLSERRAMLALVIPSDSNFDEVNNAKV